MAGVSELLVDEELLERKKILPVKQAIAKVYSFGWNPKLVKIVPVGCGKIKVKASLNRVQWAQLKFEFYTLGYVYDKSEKVFVRLDYKYGM